MTYQIFAVSGCQKIGIRNLSKDAISLNVPISDFEIKGSWLTLLHTMLGSADPRGKVSTKSSQTPNLKMLKKCAWNEFGVLFSGPIQDSELNVMDPKHWLDIKVHVVYACLGCIHLRLYTKDYFKYQLYYLQGYPLRMCL